MRASAAVKAGGAAFFFPTPRTMGFFAILITVLAFAAGRIRNELALTLLGTVFLAILAYCFFGILLTGLLCRGKTRSLSMEIAAETVNAGDEGELRVKLDGFSRKKIRFLKLPAILVRCELTLKTKDGRELRHFADPGLEEYSRFPVHARGAYFAEPGAGAPRSPDLRSADPPFREGGRFAVFDAPGFFRLSFPVRQSGAPWLLALPAPAGETLPLSLKSGGTRQRTEPRHRKSDELTSHRPYISGDDPRRINWKLYSHGPLGELFVREGEPEPPPHSRLLILVDTEADRSLFTLEEGRRATDLLCEHALAAAVEFAGRGMDTRIGYTGGGIIGGKDESGPLGAGELAEALAWPAALPWPMAPNARGRAPGNPGSPQSFDLPPAPEDRGILVLALPRASSEPSALDRFLKNRGANRETDLVFLYGAGSRRAAELEDCARVCVNLYNGKSGVRARRFAVAGGEP